MATWTPRCDECVVHPHVYRGRILKTKELNLPLIVPCRDYQLLELFPKEKSGYLEDVVWYGNKFSIPSRNRFLRCGHEDCGHEDLEDGCILNQNDTVYKEEYDVCKHHYVKIIMKSCKCCVLRYYDYINSTIRCCPICLSKK